MAFPDLPPLSAIRSFHMAARYQSLRQAAETLGVTPSAISHQIKTLEKWVGAPVFVRVGRDVRLSAVGHALAGDIARAFDLMHEAFSNARHVAEDARLRVSALPMFTQAWLLPRLGRFEAAHPGISITIDTSSRLADFERDPIDVAIRNSPKPGAELFARKLLDLKAVPLCAPHVASQIKRVEDLSKATLIHLSSGSGGWPQWLAQCGARGLRPRSKLTVDTMPAAIEAAAAGHGVMLGLHPLVWDVAVARTLVNPFSHKLLSAGAYYVVHRKADGARRPVRAFVEWITGEMRADARRLRAMPSTNARAAAAPLYEKLARNRPRQGLD